MPQGAAGAKHVLDECAGPPRPAEAKAESKDDSGGQSARSAKGEGRGSKGHDDDDEDDRGEAKPVPAIESAVKEILARRKTNADTSDADAMVCDKNSACPLQVAAHSHFVLWCCRCDGPCRSCTRICRKTSVGTFPCSG